MKVYVLDRFDCVIVKAFYKKVFVIFNFVILWNAKKSKRYTEKSVWPEFYSFKVNNVIFN